jgi:hypothetical protein
MAKHAVCVKFAQVLVQMWQSKHHIKKIGNCKKQFFPHTCVNGMKMRKYSGSCLMWSWSIQCFHSDNVIRMAKSKITLVSLFYINKISIYYYQSLNIISLVLARNDQIKRHLQYQYLHMGKYSGSGSMWSLIMLSFG